MTTFLAGLLLGVAGSAHCAGMCGPVLLVVMGGASSSRQAAGRAALIYHACRLSMYVLLAMPAGYAGRAMALAGLGRVMAIVAGGLLLLAATGSSGQGWVRPLSLAWSTVVIAAGTKARTFARRWPHLGFAMLGLVNGLIPCGLVYAAVATAAASGSVAGSAMFMSGFGLGTVPALLGVTVAAASVPLPVRRRLRFVGPALMAFAGLLLIGRGVMPAYSAVHQHSDAAPVARDFRTRATAVSAARRLSPGARHFSGASDDAGFEMTGVGASYTPPGGSTYESLVQPCTSARRRDDPGGGFSVDDPSRRGGGSNDPHRLRDDHR